MGKQFRSSALLVAGIVEPGSHRRPPKSEFNAWLQHRAQPDAGWHDDLRLLPSQDVSAHQKLPAHTAGKELKHAPGPPRYT